MRMTYSPDCVRPTAFSLRVVRQHLPAVMLQKCGYKGSMKHWEKQWSQNLGFAYYADVPRLQWMALQGQHSEWRCISGPADHCAVDINICIQANSVCSPVVAFCIHVDQFILETALSINQKWVPLDCGCGMSCSHVFFLFVFFQISCFGWITACNEFCESR